MYKLKISKRQAGVINSALDIYSRLLCGQIGELNVLFRDKIMNGGINQKELGDTCTVVKKVIFPNLHPDVSYGIYSDEAPEQAKVAYDLYQVIRNYLAWEMRSAGGYAVDFHEPLKCAKGDLAVIVKEDA